MLAAAGGIGGLDPDQAKPPSGSAWPSRTSDDAAAASVADRYAGRLDEPQDAALLRLATLAGTDR